MDVNDPLVPIISGALDFKKSRRVYFLSLFMGISLEKLKQIDFIHHSFQTYFMNFDHLNLLLNSHSIFIQIASKGHKKKT